MYVELEKYSPRYPQEMKPRLDIDRGPPAYIRPTCAIPPFQRGGECYKA